MTRVLRSVSVTTLTLFLSASPVGIHLPSEATTSAQSTRSSLAVRLGYSAQDKLLIVNADDLGMSHAIKQGEHRRDQARARDRCDDYGAVPVVSGDRRLREGESVPGFRRSFDAYERVGTLSLRARIPSS